jgi:hypothetical protein
MLAVSTEASEGDVETRVVLPLLTRPEFLNLIKLGARNAYQRATLEREQGRKSAIFQTIVFVSILFQSSLSKQNLQRKMSFRPTLKRASTHWKLTVRFRTT